MRGVKGEHAGTLPSLETSPSVRTRWSTPSLCGWKVGPADPRAPQSAHLGALDWVHLAHEVVGTHQQNISYVHVPIVQHFTLVPSRKPKHSRGVVFRAVNRVAEERIRLQAQIEASEQCEDAAQAHADAAKQRAEAAEQ